jgi:DNA-binding Xre family transcriptional regulator
MFILNVKRILRLRGIEKHYKYLLGLGFVPATANILLSSTAQRVTLEHLERLCLALNCTPNDLIEWQPNNTQAVAATHSINGLKKRNLNAMLSEVPVDKFEQIADILQDLKNK